MSKKRKTRKEKEYKFHDFKSEKPIVVNSSKLPDEQNEKTSIEPTIYKDLKKSLTLIVISVVLLIVFWLLLSKTNLFNSILNKFNIIY